MRLVLLLAIGGCAGRTYHYVHTNEPPELARKTVAARAEAIGMTRVSSVDGDRYEIDRRDKLIREGAMPDDRRLPIAGQTVYDVTATTVYEPGGSLVELTGDAALISKIHPTGESHRSADLFASDPIVWNITVDGGLAHTPASPARARVDAGFQVGHRVWSTGGEDPGITTRRRIAVLGGVGLVADHEARIRPEVSFLYDLQDMLVTVLDRKVPRGRRKAVELSLAVPIGISGHDRYGIETTATAHVPPFGGVFVRAGYDRGDRGAGASYMVGVRLDTVSAITALALGATFAAAVGLGTIDVDWKDIFSCSPKNDPDC